MPPKPPGGTPAAEVDVDERLVARLLEAQHPDLAGLPLARSDSGWDNVTVRLGDELSVRLPRRAAAAPLIDKEQQWLPELADRLPLATPVPRRRGVPGCGYPWRWSVVDWILGAPAAHRSLEPGEAAPWGELLRALHVEAPAEAPENPFRGGPLAARDGAFRRRLVRLGGAVDAPAIAGAWRAGLEAPAAAARRWIHGDLHARNVIAEGGRLRGVIDWGDLAAGDVATDLASAWALFDPADHPALWRAYGEPGEAALARARAWAVYFAVTLLDAGRVDDPVFAAAGRLTLARVLD